MAEPISMFARFRLSAADYITYFRSQAIKNISKELFECIQFNFQDAYCYSYNKKRGELTFFALYNHGNDETVKGKAYQGLKELGNMDLSSLSGYIATTVDGFNWDNIVSFEAYENNKWVGKKYTDVPAKAVKQAALLCMNLIEEPYPTQYAACTTVDANMTKKVLALQEKHRLNNLANYVAAASTLDPIHLFADFYYNGQLIFQLNNGVHLRPQLDIQSFKPALYGACDANHVLVQHKWIACNSQKFKRITKDGSVFYKTPDAVYTVKGEKLVNADVKTFKIINEHLEEDAYHVYYMKQVFIKNGEPYFFKTLKGYNCLFGMAGQFFFNNYALAVDPATFQWEVQLEGMLSSYSGFVGRDKDGVFVFFIDHKNVSLVRNAQWTIAEAKETYENKYAYKYYRWQDDERIWDQVGTALFKEEFLHTQQTAGIFYQMEEIRRFIQLVLLQYETTNELAVLKRLWVILDWIEPYLWLVPEVYVELAVLYNYISDTPKALASMCDAITHGAQNLVHFTTDARLANLKENVHFKELTAYIDIHDMLNSKPVMSLETIEKALALTSSVDIGFKVLTKYVLYDRADFTQFMQDYPTDMEYWTRYKQLTEKLFDRCFTKEKVIDYVYNYFADYEFMPIEGHLQMVNYELMMSTVFKADVARFMLNVKGRLNRIQQLIYKLVLIDYAHYKELFNANAVVQLFDMKIT